MKSLKLLAFALVICLGANAQTGTWYIGGTAGFGSTKNTPNNPANPNPNETTTANWNFSPEFGTWLTDNIQLGLGVNMNGTTNQTNGNKTSSNTNFNPTLYGRYYWRTASALSFFAGLNMQVITGSTTTYGAGQQGQDLEGKNSGFATGIDAGIAYALGEKVGIMGRLGMAGFRSTKNTPDNTQANVYNTRTQTGLFLNSLGPVFNIGLYYTLF